MIAFLRGELYGTTDNSAIVECNGVGYEVTMSGNDLENLPDPGENVLIHTYLNVNENTGVNLFGFLEREDLKMFKQLITVSGVGPKVAVGILGTLPSKELSYAIVTDNAKAISKAPGVGSKLASKIILELKDKVFPTEIVSEELPGKTESADSADMAEAVDGLVALGYSKKDAEKAVKKAAKPDMTAEQILNAAFAYL